MNTFAPNDAETSFDNGRNTTTPAAQPPSDTKIKPSGAFIVAARTTLVYAASCAAAVLAGLLIAHLLHGQRSTERSITLAGNELLYRACAREAMLKHIPIKPYPQESERISLVREGGRIMQRLERLEADVMNMRVENGCEVSLQRHELMEPLQDIPLALAPVTPASHSPVIRDEIIVDTIDPTPPAPISSAKNCDVSRDMSMQSHFMLLKQCVSSHEKTSQPDKNKGFRQSRAALRVAT